MSLTGLRGGVVGTDAPKITATDFFRTNPAPPLHPVTFVRKKTSRRSSIIGLIEFCYTYGIHLRNEPYGITWRCGGS